MSKGNVPLYSLFSAVVLVALGILALAVVPAENENVGVIIALVATTVPALIAAAFAERASNDIRNGTVTERARRGAKQALDETGVTDVVEITQRGESSIVAMQALARLLESNTQATQTNTEGQNR